MKQPEYCCFCGEELTLKILLDGTREKYCSKCNHVFFDAPSPSVIVAVTNADKILLTRSVGWKHSYWGLIAGHLKAGETAEEAALREVYEEVGLTISDLKILKTFIRTNEDADSDLLMIAFTAEANDTQIRKGKELAKAAWFRLSEPLPLRPNAISTQIVTQTIHQMRSLDSEK